MLRPALRITGMLIEPRMISLFVGEINIANCIRGQGRAPTPETPTPWGTDACPPNPLGNFSGLILGIASGATRGDAELEADWERFECPMGGALGLGILGTYLDEESV